MGKQGTGFRSSTYLTLYMGAAFLVAGLITIAYVNYEDKQRSIHNADRIARIILDRNPAADTYFLKILKPAVFNISGEARPKNHIDPVERTFLEELDRDPNLKVRSGVRTLDGQPYFVVMKRGETLEEACMRCHSRPAQTVSLRIPLSAAYADTDMHSIRLSGILASIFLVLFIVQYAVGRRLVFSPIEAVRDRALQIADGEQHLGERIPDAAGREVRELANAFNEMSSRLGRDRDTLEDRVSERTAEINKINEILRSDVEKRRRVEADLKRSEARLRAIFEGASIGFALVDRSGRLMDTNHFFENFIGYAKDELRGMTFVDITHPDDVESDQAHYREIWDGTRERYLLEKRYIRKDRRVVWGRKVVSRADDRDGEPRYVINMVEDITERKQYEEEALKARKLESLGVLAGGIAHDFNNYLTAILGNISLIKVLEPPGGKIHERLDETEKAALRAKMLSHQLITFATGGTPVRKSASLDELIKDSATFALRGSKAKCRFSLPDDLWTAEIDEGQISQVLNHLVMNADQAMPGGGIIEIAAENARVGKDSLLNIKPGRYLRIRVRDRGIGIPAEHLHRIFDPYFTTKAGRSGLGLTAAHSIVHKHDGILSVESEPGKGTTFTIHLPASGEKAPPDATAGERPAGRGGRILVMDDEEMVRSVSREMLKTLGYEVETAGDGLEAIELFLKARENGAPFDAVLMDLTIPGGMGGEETIKRLLEIDPGVRAVVSSGYSDDPVMANHGKYGFRGVITKPFRVSELSITIQKVLEPE